MLHGWQQEAWTETAYLRIAVNFCTAVTEEIKKQQEAVFAARATCEMALAQEKATHDAMTVRRKTNHLEGKSKPSLRAEVETQIFLQDLARQREENELSLRQASPLAFLSLETEGALGSYVLLPLLQDKLRTLAKQQVSTASLREENAAGHERPTCLAESSEVDAPPSDPSSFLSQNRGSAPTPKLPLQKMDCSSSTRPAVGITDLNDDDKKSSYVRRGLVFADCAPPVSGAYFVPRVQATRPPNPKFPKKTTIAHAHASLAQTSLNGDGECTPVGQRDIGGTLLDNMSVTDERQCDNVPRWLRHAVTSSSALQFVQHTLDAQTRNRDEMFEDRVKWVMRNLAAVEARYGKRSVPEQLSIDENELAVVALTRRASDTNSAGSELTAETCLLKLKEHLNDVYLEEAEAKRRTVHMSQLLQSLPQKSVMGERERLLRLQSDSVPITFPPSCRIGQMIATPSRAHIHKLEKDRRDTLLLQMQSNPVPTQERDAAERIRYDSSTQRPNLASEVAEGGWYHKYVTIPLPREDDAEIELNPSGEPTDGRPSLAWYRNEVQRYLWPAELEASIRHRLHGQVVAGDRKWYPLQMSAAEVLGMVQHPDARAPESPSDDRFRMATRTSIGRKRGRLAVPPSCGAGGDTDVRQTVNWGLLPFYGQYQGSGHRSQEDDRELPAESLASHKISRFPSLPSRVRTPYLFIHGRGDFVASEATLWSGRRTA